MEYKVMITPRPLCNMGMELLSKKADSLVVDPANCNFTAELQKVDALMLKEGGIGRPEMLACPRLKVIARHGIGFDTVDVDAATELGIPVVITPGANSRSVAEHTVAMILALTKNLVESHNETVKGNWNVRQEFRAFEFQGKVIGLIGVGSIGKMVANMCSGLGFQVAAYDPFIPAEQLVREGYQACSCLDEILQCSDIISVHVPYNQQTKNLIGKRELEKMKRTGILINCARGGIVNEEDLVQALRDGIISGAGVDVFVGEQLRRDNPLASAPHLIQFGPSDYAMSCGLNLGEHRQEIFRVEENVIRTAQKHGIAVRCEIATPGEAERYIDLGVQHFCLGDEMKYLLGQWQSAGGILRNRIDVLGGP
ncbi:MAG: hydroxyacid dehydrogenase [Lawsonibacter sp.]|jgi:D-3-phosphoglycerate dehydrogenase